MANQKKEARQSDSDYHSGLMILFVVGSIVFYQTVVPWITWFIREHKFLSFILIYLFIFGLWKLVLWRIRVNNPEKFKRTQIFKFMERLHQVPGCIWIGKTLKDDRRIFLTPEMRTGHVQILGATGRGKTKSVIVPWFLRDVKNYLVPILIDARGLVLVVRMLSLFSARYLHLEISWELNSLGFLLK